MAIPTYQQLFLPLLARLKSGEELRLREIIPDLAVGFDISPEELTRMLPSGGMTLFENRVGWARTYLSQAGLIQMPRRGFVQITEEGLKILQSNISKLEVKDLRRYPSFIDFENRSKAKRREESTSDTVEEVESDLTPEDAMREAHDRIRAIQEHELLSLLRNGTPAFFERVVVDVIVAMGYGGSVEDAGQAIGKSGDGGIDGIIKQDKLGLDQIFLQAKRWENSIQRPQLQGFVGALHGRHASKGIFITTSDFTAGALEYAQTISAKLILINGRELVQYMYDYDVGVSTERTYVIKRVDQDYFDIG